MTVGPTRRLTDATWTEIAEAASNEPLVLVVPVGSIEQHGPHLPLDTDVAIAEYVAKAAVAKSSAHVWLGPTIALGSAGEHAGFPGTLSIGQASTADTLIELARSAIAGEAAWCKSIVLVVGHGGNVEPVIKAVRVCRSEGRSVRCWFPADPGGDAHAGHTETSVMLAIDPGRVGNPPPSGGFTGPLSRVRETLISEGLVAVTQNGILGDASSASASYGETLVARWIDEVCSQIED